MVFQVEITETLQRIVSIEAESENAAHLAVKEMYRNEEIVLDNSDYIDTEIEILKK